MFSLSFMLQTLSFSSLNLFLSESRVPGVQDECTKALFDIKDIVLHKLFVFKGSVLYFLKRVLFAFAK